MFFKAAFPFLLSLVSLNILAQSKLKEMEGAIRAGSYPKIHGLLIAQKGQTIYEQYFDGFTADSLHDTRSSFKSVTSILVGIALDKGFIRNIDEKVHTYFPDDTAFARHALKRQMTIRNLLEMRSGLDCDEWNNSKDCESAMERSHDWVRFSLAVPVGERPGTKWAYTSCAPMIVGGILEKATGMSVMQFANKYLFRPMGIETYRWTTDPAGHGMTAGSFYMKPADMLKIGQMVLDHGQWHGKRIVSAQWLRQSVHGSIAIPDGSFVKTSRTTAAIPQPVYYGFYWYNELIKTKTGTYPAIFASGNGGQYVIVIEPLQMVVVFTQGNYGSRTAKQAFDMLARYILP